MKTFGQRLLEHMQQLSITQQKLSDLTGINVMQINHYIKDRREPNFTNLVLILNVLTFEAEDVFDLVIGQKK